MSGEQITDINALDAMSPEEIAAATKDGRLTALLSGDNDAIAMAKADVLIAEREAAAAAKSGNVDQGARGTTTTEGQVTAAELETMSAEQIARATAQGRMADLLG